MLNRKKRIAILASGSGTNAENLVIYCSKSTDIDVATVITDRAGAGVVERLRPLGIEVEHYGKPHWLDPTDVTAHLLELGVDLVVLAGFLAIIREPLLSAFADRIVNLHPSLLPRHGGPGMYGHHVHRAVLAAGDKQSGITIHLVNAQVDGGRVLAQYACEVFDDDTPERLAERIHTLEYAHYPSVVADYLRRLPMGR